MDLPVSNKHRTLAVVAGGAPMADKAALAAFTQAVWAYYHSFGRHDLPWRATGPDGTLDPYAVLVSELMLQQTQVSRAVPKFREFMTAFPTAQALAAASLADVLRLWSGLGYNRRAKFLWQASGIIVRDYGGSVPSSRAELITLPGIGSNTAGAILAYAWNQPVAYVETNIRSVFIYHFFSGKAAVADTELLPLITACVPGGQIRDWYWALMDYGTHLKQSVGNTARASKTYAKQSAFHGSRRKIRGIILKTLTEGPATDATLQQLVQDDRLEAVLADLMREEFIAYHNGSFALRA